MDFIKIVKRDSGKYLGKIIGSNILPDAIEQTMELTKAKGFINFVMYPDAHAGEIPVGVMIKTKNFAYFDWIGNDIGCGIRGIKVRSKISQSFADRIANYVLDFYTGKDMPSIGGGNHFFEIARDSEGSFWLLIHTGSRGFGGKTYKEIHKELSLLDIKGVHIQSKLFKQLYYELWEFAHEQARANRSYILNDVERTFNLLHYKEDTKIKQNTIDIVHNTFSISGDFVYHYKGAAKIKPYERAIIPMNMRDGSLLIRATEKIMTLGGGINHGAGRISSRTDFKATHTADVLNGINVLSKEIPIDEAPEAYKDIRDDMKTLEQLGYIEILDVLKPIVTVKV